MDLNTDEAGMASGTRERRTVAGRSRSGNSLAQNLAHTRRQHAREIAEDYAEAIAELIAQNGEARVMDLAGRLGVTHVTVNRTITRLRKAGLVTSQPHRGVALTRQGQRLAAASKNRHDTVVRFLLSLGIPKRVAGIDAEGIEHHVSPKTLTAFRAALQKGTS
jgi:DtxR family manganese transport transcriptional regulator